MLKNIIIFGAGVLCGLVVSYGFPSLVPSSAQSLSQQLSSTTTPSESRATTLDTSTDNNSTATPNPSAPESTEPVYTIRYDSLTSAQQTALKAVGYGGTDIVISTAMLGCIESRLGAERLADIQGGAIPSLTESLALVACYTSQ